MVRQALLAYKLKELRKKLEPLLARKKELEEQEREFVEQLNGEMEERSLSDEDFADLEKLIGENEEERKSLETQIEELEKQEGNLEKELEELNEAHEEVHEEQNNTDDKEEKQGENMERHLVAGDQIREGRFFRGMERAYVENLLAREDVQNFLANVREMAEKKRAIQGAEIGIPKVILPLLREKVEGYSKLRKHVNFQTVRGDATQPIMGTIPEAVWIEACTNINELDLEFNAVDLGRYAVAGYYDVCIADLQDSDLLSADLLFDMLSQAIGYAIDKAILYGTGVKMPLGIVTRLAQATQPSNYGPQAPEWKNLSTTNLLKTTEGKTGTEFYSEVMGLASVAHSTYAKKTPFWAMNRTTLLKLKQALLAFNANGALVAEVNNTLPLIGGAIEEFNFIPDGDIIGGFGELYTYGMREDVRLAQSEHVRFLQDHIIFKGISRGDGAPVFGEAFVAFNINGADVTTSVAFAPDTANEVETP